MKTRKNLHALMISGGLTIWCRTSAQSIGFALLSLLMFASPIVATAQKYEPPATLKASQIVPQNLLSSPDYRIDEQVKNDGFLNHYKIKSKFGEFTAVSNATLRKRIWEARAMVAMDKVTGTKEFKGLQIVYSAPNAVRLKTVSLKTPLAFPRSNANMRISLVSMSILATNYSRSAWTILRGQVMRVE